MRDLDLFKVIIIASLVLMLPAGGWIYWQQGEIKKTSAALKRAEKSDGTLFKIGQLQEEVERFKRSVGRVGYDVNSLLRTPIESRVDPGRCASSSRTASWSTAGSRSRTCPARSPSSSPGLERPADLLPAGDLRHDLSGREWLSVHLSELGPGSPIWKLRKLRLTHDEVKNNSKEAPPDELSDSKWIVRELEFRRRQKRSGG